MLNLKVHCFRHSEEGCQWVGELRHVVSHERDECGWAVVDCSYQCGAHLPRRLMAEHEDNTCPQRPIDSRVLKRMEDQHKKEINQMEIRLTALETRLASVETKLMSDREHHERELAAQKVRSNI